MLIFRLVARFGRGRGRRLRNWTLLVRRRLRLLMSSLCMRIRASRDTKLRIVGTAVGMGRLLRCGLGLMRLQLIPWMRAALLMMMISLSCGLLWWRVAARRRLVLMRLMGVCRRICIIRINRGGPWCRIGLWYNWLLVCACL